MLVIFAFALYLTFNFVGNFNKLPFLIFVIVRLLLLEGYAFLVLENAFLPIAEYSLGLNKLRELLTIAAGLFRFKVVEFVVPREVVNQRTWTVSCRYELILLSLPRVIVRVSKRLQVLLHQILHFSLSDPEALLGVVFLQQLNKGLINLAGVLHLYNLWASDSEVLLHHLLSNHGLLLLESHVFLHEGILLGISG